MGICDKYIHVPGTVFRTARLDMDEKLLLVQHSPISFHFHNGTHRNGEDQLCLLPAMSNELRDRRQSRSPDCLADSSKLCHKKVPLPKSVGQYSGQYDR